MQKNIVISIAIDGPAGAGKTSVAQRLSQELGILYLNTGAMYRAAGLQALRQNIDPLDEAGVLTFLSDLNIDVAYESGTQQTLLNGEDVSALITSPEASDAASKISSLKSVREKLVEVQQILSRRQSLIIDGRDIGTVVLPNATHKFFLDAKLYERANRRYQEYLKKGKTDVSLEEIMADMKERDHRDSTRAASPLKQAQDAIYIDSSNMTIDEVVGAMLKIIKG